MTTLQEIMSPKSIAIVGASDNKAQLTQIEIVFKVLKLTLLY